MLSGREAPHTTTEVVMARKNSARRPQSSKQARSAKRVEKVTGYAFVRNSNRILVLDGSAWA